MQNGVTALHRAAIDGHADVARALLDGGCSMDKKDEVIIVAIKTPAGVAMLDMVYF